MKDTCVGLGAGSGLQPQASRVDPVCDRIGTNAGAHRGLRRRYSRHSRFLVLCLASSPSLLVQAGATTDGSVGAVQTLAGHFTVPQTLGTVAGANLFHSFARFGIDPGESATFTTTSSSIQNVISRVTAGEQSVIHGLLKLDAAAGSRPDFYFVNPAGVVFRAGTQIDVPAGFHVGTAQQLKFGDGSIWDTSAPTVSALTVAPPESFGFLGGRTAAPLIFNNQDANGTPGARPNIVLKPGNTFSAAAGAVRFDSARVSVSEGGQIRVMAAGDVSIRNGSLISSTTASDNTAGAIDLHGTSLTIDRGSGGRITGIQSRTDGAGDAGLVRVNVSGQLSVLGGEISSETNSIGSAGRMEIEAGALTINGFGSARGIFNDATKSSTGATNSGRVRLAVVGELSLLDGGQISSSTASGKPAGSVEIEAGTLAIDRANRQSTGIFSIAGRDSNADAGSINISVADSFSIAGGGEVSSGTRSGSAGSIQIEAKSFTIDRGRVSSAAGSGSFGNGGAIKIKTADTFSLINGGRVSSSTSSLGQGGSIDIEADSATIDGRGSNTETGVFSRANAGSSGDAGRIKMRVHDHLAILNEGMISSGTNARGSTGTIDVEARSITIDRRGASDLTGIFTESGRGASGSLNTGRIQVTTTNTLSLLNGGQISASTASEKPGGSIAVEAGTLVIDRGGKQATGIFSIAGQHSNNDAGDIKIEVTDDASILRGGEISSGTQSGRGGVIDLHVGSLTVDGDGSRIAAAATANSLGQPGSVKVAARETLTIRNNGRLSIQNNGVLAREATALLHEEAVAQAPIEPTTLSVSARTITMMAGAQITASSTGNVAASDVEVSAGEGLTLRNAAITTTAVDGDGGGIEISGGRFMLMDHARVSTSVLGSQNGNGGDIALKADILLMQTGFIQANTAATQARGGDVSIDVGLLVSTGALLLGGDTALVFDPSLIGVNVIQAAAPGGVSGNVQVSSPIVDIAGSLRGLSTEVIDYGVLGRDLCRVGLGSSFTPVGRGGLRVSSRGWIRDEGSAGNLSSSTERLRQADALHSVRLHTSPGCR